MSCKVLDLRGLKCPLPLIRIQSSINKIQTNINGKFTNERANGGGKYTDGLAVSSLSWQLLVIVNDPIAQLDIPVFCQENNFLFLVIKIVNYNYLLKTINITFDNFNSYIYNNKENKQQIKNITMKKKSGNEELSNEELGSGKKITYPKRSKKQIKELHGQISKLLLQMANLSPLDSIYYIEI